MKRAGLLLVPVALIAMGVWFTLPPAGEVPAAGSPTTATADPAPPRQLAANPQPSRAPVTTGAGAPTRPGVDPRPPTLIGRVLDALGHPLADCTVAFSEVDVDGVLAEARDEAACPRVTTAVDGRFRLRLEADRVGTVTLEHHDFAVRIAAHRVRVGQGETRDLGDLTLFSLPGLIVNVRTRAHAAVPNAIVDAEPALRDVSLPRSVHDLGNRTGVTNGGGQTVLYGMSPGPYTLRVTAPHCATREVSHLQPDQSARAPELLIEVDAGYPISGRAEGPVGVDPGRTTVRAAPLDGGAELTDLVSADGDFRLSGATLGRYRVTVESQHLGRAQADVDVPGRRVILTLDGGKSIRGVVRARATREPVPAVIVQAEPEDGWPMVRAGETVRPHAVTNRDGFFCVVGLVDGRFTLELTSELFVPARIGPFPADSQPIEVYLDRGLAVRGTLRCNGQVIAGARVIALEWGAEGSTFALWRASLVNGLQRQIFSNADGNFDLRGVALEGRRLLIEASDCAPWSSAPLRGDEGETLDLGTIELTVGAIVEGTAEPHSTVHLDGVTSSGLSRTTHADDKGRFAFRNLPAGSYIVFFRSEERAEPTGSAAGARPTIKSAITVGPGDRKSVSLFP